jgi:hypothetical protein
MLIKNTLDVRPSEITPKRLCVRRHEFLTSAASTISAALAVAVRKGLRIDEAIHPATLLVTGLYGE